MGVPESFISSLIKPGEKDKLYDSCSYGTYRSISLVTVFSNVFQSCLANRLELDNCFDSL